MGKMKWRLSGEEEVTVGNLNEFGHGRICYIFVYMIDSNLARIKGDFPMEIKVWVI